MRETPVTWALACPNAVHATVLAQANVCKHWLVLWTHVDASCAEPATVLAQANNITSLGLKTHLLRMLLQSTCKVAPNTACNSRLCTVTLMTEGAWRSTDRFPQHKSCSQKRTHLWLSKELLCYRSRKAEGLWDTRWRERRRGGGGIYGEIEKKRRGGV